MRLLFTTRGRIPRSQWWGGIVILVGYHLICGLLLWQTLGESLILTGGGRTILFAVNLVGLVMAYCLAVKRFQDRDKPATYARLAAAVTLLKMVLDWLHVTGDPWALTGLDKAFFVVQIGIGIWFLVELGFLRGTDGENRYGPDPLGTPATAR